MKFVLPLTLCLSLFTTIGSGQDSLRYASFSFTSSNGTELPYRLLPPSTDSVLERYPLILFLHGGGERGSDNESQLLHGSDWLRQAQGEFPAYVLFPQCARESYWADATREEGGFSYQFQEEPKPYLGAALELVDHMKATLPIDPRRIYIAGLSMGGMGTFEALARRPDLFAAAVPICGGGLPSLAPLYAEETPLWIFHGGKDDIVPPDYSRDMAHAIHAAGGDARLTIFPDANHNSWDSTFAHPEVLPWLFEQERDSHHAFRFPRFDSVQVTTHTYARLDDQNYALDLYRPFPETVNRPLVLFVHGGGFSGGLRNDELATAFARSLARHGFVVASMSYRLTAKGKGFSCNRPAAEKIQTFQFISEDIGWATRFLLDRYEAFNINPGAIVLAGSSAGAEGVLHAAYRLDWSQPAPAFHYAGVISMAGAIADTTWINADNAVPTLLFHGVDDPLVPYGSAPHHYCAPDDPGYLPLHGGASIADRLRSLQRPYYLITDLTGGHEWAGRPMQTEIKTTVEFLVNQVLNKEWEQIHRRAE